MIRGTRFAYVVSKTTSFRFVVMTAMCGFIAIASVFLSRESVLLAGIVEVINKWTGYRRKFFCPGCRPLGRDQVVRPHKPFF